MRPTAVKAMKLGTSDSYMKRMPSALIRLRISVLAISISCVVELMRSKLTAAPNMPSTADKTMTIAIRIRKMTTGWGTMFPTRSTPSRNRCITVFGATTAVVLILPLLPLYGAETRLRGSG